ncbi:hypothetical protein [Pontibacter burrus]|uniref:Lipoprotein n=1 Tax=Pontibacter burrus TaxID=2704466 RepID=A0A6B3LHQ7_9BACT|nr:hypothetical protein [Pontibacter burrus]NEM96119.1 hypothetical protein [Pontibacter burrus]
MRLLFLAIVFAITACSQPDQNSNSETETGRLATVSSKKASSAQVKSIVASNCEYDNLTKTLGIGLVSVPAAFELFSDSLLTSSYMQWDMYSSDVPPKPVCSKYYSPEYGIVQFVCLAKTTKYYKVLSGYDQVFYLPVEDGYEFTTWYDYILSSFGVRRNTDLGDEWKNQPLRKLPDLSSGELKIPEGLEMFCAMEVKGDWLKVKYDCFYNTETPIEEGLPCHQYIDKCNDTVTGWLKWKDGNNVLMIS